MKPTSACIRRAVWWLAGAAALSIVATVGAFVIEFHADPVQHDVDAWAGFGSYFGGVLGPILSVINLAALLLVAVVVTEQQQSTLASKRLALDMLAQWNGADLHASRQVISDLIDRTPDPARLPTFSELEAARTPESVHAFRLCHFLEQWAVLKHLGEVDTAILATAIGSRALWYRARFFEPVRCREGRHDVLKTLNLIEEELFRSLTANADMEPDAVLGRPR